MPLALTALYDEHVERVWKILHRLGVPSRDVPDLVQEVFLVVHRREAELGDRPVPPFLWGVAVGLVQNHRRKAFRRLEVATDVETSGGSDPERALIDARRRRALETALDALDPEKRAAFVMFELEGLSGQAIADELGVPIGTVHSRLHHARVALRASLTALGEGIRHEGSEP